MASWAAIAQKVPVKEEVPQVIEEHKKRVAVIDANAIIHASGLLNLVKEADRIITTPEVLKEVRDKQSRALLASLPFKIETQDPTDDAVAAITKFARATGDLHALSSQDIRLIALTRAIETSYYGSDHLRDAPPPPKLQKKSKKSNIALPGWGAEGGEWSEMDRLNEEEIAAAEAALGRGVGEGSRIADQVQQLSLDDTATTQQQRQQHAGIDDDMLASQQQEEDDEEEEEGDDDQGWEVAGKTPNKTRRIRRKAIRRAQREQEEQQEASDSGSEYETDDDEEEQDDDANDQNSEDNSENSSDDDDAATTTTASGHESLVCIVTGDFAMQNVILQMGLRLAAPDGKRITSISRWVLRCTACSNITKEVGRLFCPRCGNATLDRVHVTVRPDGTEQYGVRKKHVLRGTKFSLPKPKGGRHNDIILTEDVLMVKARRLARKKGAAELDPFAPEYGDETWHQKAVLSSGDRSTAALMAGWKRNPNERKHIATNRRRK